MRKAGGIIAGVFGVFAALVTLLLGGAASAFEAENASMVVGLGWGGLAFTAIVIVLGAVCLNSTSAWPGVLMIVASIAGAILGGTLVAFCMVLSLIGGVLALFGGRASKEVPA